MRRGPWVWIRLGTGAGILAVLVWQLGPDAFIDPLGRIDLWSLVAATAIAVVTTLCCAWRWQLVSRGLGADLPLRGAVLACYRSQFLNTVLPGGVLGDVHRAVTRGRDVGDVGHGVRGVVWERTAGQVVQVAVTVAVLLLLPSPVHGHMPLVAAALAAAALVTTLAVRQSPGPTRTRAARFRRAVVCDLRRGVLSRQVWPGLVVASIVAVAGHTATFLIAARTAGSNASLLQLLPLALLVLLAMGLPTNVAGWGPREGAAAWAFAVAGLGATAGLATAVVYGVMVLVATLPGALVLLAGWAQPGGSVSQRRRPDPPLTVTPGRTGGGSDG